MYLLINKLTRNIHNFSDNPIKNIPKGFESVKIDDNINIPHPNGLSSCKYTETGELLVQDALQSELYHTLRVEAYPSIEDQLDKIYHEGIDVWKAEIALIKAKHPKPQE